MRKIKNCPLCGSEMETTDYQHYFHPNNDCILHGFGFDINARRSVKSWNTRKPMERIVECLEDTKTTCFVTGITANPYEFGACHAIDKAIEIVKEEM